ncbi:unnamed protein product [Lathyrus sativus]|nr:unnamed protein product [Lathyrus sativus]
MVKLFGLGSEPVIGILNPSKKREYRVTNSHQEGKCHLYVVVFNFINSRYVNVFAIVGSKRVTIYHCLEGRIISVLQSHVKEDKDESFYIVSWTCNPNSSPYVVDGGTTGVIRVIGAGNKKMHKSLAGHGDSIKEIKTPNFEAITGNICRQR